MLMLINDILSQTEQLVLAAKVFERARAKV